MSLIKPAVGLAYSGIVPHFVNKGGLKIDYVEVPFELLEHNPDVMSIKQEMPIILHSASLSVAGSRGEEQQTIGRVRARADETQTPWIGEHLSFIVAERDDTIGSVDAYAPGEPYNIGYTLSPPMNEGSIDHIVRRLKNLQAWFPVPIIVENAPIYVKAPGTTMGQADFIRQVCEQADVGFLFDIAHFVISSRNMGFDAEQELASLPIDRVVEVHVSGMSDEAGVTWDNHASRAPETVYALLKRVARRAQIQAVTLEYNWSVRFPLDVLQTEIGRVRAAMS
jgi:uncharacterized protein